MAAALRARELLRGPLDDLVRERGECDASGHDGDADRHRESSSGEEIGDPRPITRPSNPGTDSLQEELLVDRLGVTALRTLNLHFRFFLLVFVLPDREPSLSGPYTFQSQFCDTQITLLLQHATSCDSHDNTGTRIRVEAYRKLLS